MPYSYYAMKPKAQAFKYTSISHTGVSTYTGYNTKLEGTSAEAWSHILDSLGEDTQLAILRGITVTGVGVSDWNAIFTKIAHGTRPFDTMAKAFLEGHIDLNWQYFAEKLAKESYHNLHYPAICPEWFYPYTYSQRDYLADLSHYWSNIHDDYYKPWAITQLGHDSPEVARLKRLGEEARREMDRVARQSKRHLK